jgi:hypothetical protein
VFASFSGLSLRGGRATAAAAALLCAAVAALTPRGAQGQQAAGPDETARADSAAAEDARAPFAIQINASPDAALVAGQLDSLRRRGVPAYRTQTTTDAGTTFHRLRVGPIRGRAAARAFARCRGYADPWIVPTSANAASEGADGRTARDVTTDVVSLRPRPPRVLLGRSHAFAAFLMPPYGNASDGTQPATLRVYTPARDEPAVVERVTGVREAEDGLEFGRAERVFVRRDTSATTADYSAEVKAFSRAQGLSSYLVRDQLAFYGGGRVARFTLLGLLSLPGGMPTMHRQPGFDYVDPQGRTARHQGAPGPGRTRKMGNALTRRLLQNAPTHVSTDRTALFARPTARSENAQVCLLFFAE